MNLQGLDGFNFLGLDGGKMELAKGSDSGARTSHVQTVTSWFCGLGQVTVCLRFPVFISQGSMSATELVL